ncbi:MAG: SUMF1/EgtB/PvdO family nonheme iron enzyme [bacterium]|nr:SUMF1/EgtB/PvdO family nonheme iron enzyme [bacterium]
MAQTPTPPSPNPGKKSTDSAIRAAYISGVFLLIGAVIAGLFQLGSMILASRNQNNPLPPPTTAVAQVPSDTPTLSGFQQLQTVQAEQTISAATRDALNLTATVQFIADSNATATAQQFAVTETAARLTLLALSFTPEPTATETPIPPTATNTPTPTLSPEQIALTPQTSNVAWQPYITERDFGDGIPMMLVPAGCFMMGHEDWVSDERPVHEVCLNVFWIDKYEVMQSDFERLEGVKANENHFDGTDRPVENITWFEARDFCILREGRLPTEAELEYAARGPNGLLFPWSNQFVRDNAVFEENSMGQTAEVGSRPRGVSWVGAYDLSGNVWEWGSTIYGIDDDFNLSEVGERLFPYPYVLTDGREQDSNNRAHIRVMRGGAYNNDSGALRSSFRSWYYPYIWNNDVGFRCARSF